MYHKLIIILLGLLLLPPLQAQEQYTYEKEQELTPLINWHDYGSQAFEQAIKENKPIFLLLTALSWCYWCQVYESEDLFNNGR